MNRPIETYPITKVAITHAHYFFTPPGKEKEGDGIKALFLRPEKRAIDSRNQMRFSKR